ncbi:TonB-dependent receptor [uncultured Bacteroides sp.]|uniref:SusC/RagA family TonB-linked outer membrane protein n=1 Tax=uncultured Bacteroides sp. TaxID=162156 RepID=UPI002674877D|nr:TonB-dependent receptor [uncultured Bacteroides sp.]
MKNKKFLCSICFLFIFMPVVWGQNITVKGNVTSKTDGQPVIGASVVETAVTANGTITDLDGNFTLTVKQGADLTISYVGFKPVRLKAKALLNVVLEEDSELLDEVVVTGYSTQKKADLTGSVAVVSTKALKTTSDADPMRALQGKVPGMTITSNGSPSGTGTVRIRGIGSFNSSQDPLYVVDGVPTTRALNSLNTNDIESMQVLKDAASASIYGSRASNGVIIITTKKGKKADKIKVDFSANLTAQFYTPQSLMKLSNTSEYATAMAQAALNDGLDPVAYASNYGLNLNAAAGTPITVWNPATESYVDYTVNGLYDGYINQKKTMKFSDTDWLDEISRTGFSQNYDLSLSHANDKHSTMFSLGYKKNNGILKYTDFENISARMNSSYNVNKYLTVGENFTVTYTSQVDCAPMENALKMAPTVPVYEEDGTTFAGPVGGMSDRQNPLRESYDNRDNHLDYWRLFGNGYVEIKPVKGLVLRSNFGIDHYSSFINSMTYTYHSDIVNNDIAKTTLSHNNETNWTWSNTANYNFRLADKHDFTVLLGTEMSKQSVIDFSAYSEEYAVEDKDYMWPNAATGTMRNSGAKVGYRLASFFGKLDYNYDDLILASFTIRRDGSSRFGKDNRWGTFPAATLGLRLSKLLKKDWMDDWKIRFSWGKTGNQAIDNNAQFGLYVADYGLDRVTSTAYDLLLQSSGTFPSGYRATQIANPNLKWESAEQFNIGTDFTLFGGSLYGSIDGFVKDVDDMLINPAYLGALGEGGASWANGPSLRNWGMEFTLGYRKTLACGLGIDVNGNLDFFRNRVTYLPETSTGSYAHTTTENLVESRQPYGSIVGYVVEGIFQNQAEVDASGQPNARVGGLKYADLDGKNGITADDQTWIFNPVPAFSYGLNIALSYKGFDLSMFWQGVYDKDVYNNQKFQTDFWSVTDAGSNKGNRLLGAWNTNNTGSTIPALTTNNTADEGRASTYFVENGSYLKLRNLQVGYNLPTSFLSKFKMGSARIYLSGQNLLTIKSKSLTCSDPENPDWNYPLATSVSFGLQLGF